MDLPPIEYGAPKYGNGSMMCDAEISYPISFFFIRDVPKDVSPTNIFNLFVSIERYRRKISIIPTNFRTAL